MAINFNDISMENSTNYNDIVSIVRDPDTNIPIMTTMTRMRGLVNNYSNPVSSILAKLYEALLVKINSDMDIKMLKDIKIMLSIAREEVVEEGYFDKMSRKERLRSSDSESLIDLTERTLFEIQDKDIECVVIYEDLYQITSIPVPMLADFARDMAEVEIEFIFDDIDYPTRKIRHNEIVEIYTNKIFKSLAEVGINIENFNFIDACGYLKCVF